jgi:hypothetical protein
MLFMYVGFHKKRKGLQHFQPVILPAIKSYICLMIDRSIRKILLFGVERCMYCFD